MWLVAAGLPLLSLLVLREPSYDPTAWLIWGREVAHGSLSTVGGPSWKPLPVLFTTAFALAGDHAAPVLWLFVARAGAMAALVAAYAVTRRLTGSVASGLLAAAALALASDFLFNAFRGDSEGILVALTLAAVLLHLHGREHAAFATGAAAALLRPEVWPLLAAYAVLLLHRHRDARTGALVAGSAAVVLAAWFVPEHLGSGDWMRSGARARNPVPGSPGQSGAPFVMTFVNGSVALSIPVYAGAVYAVTQAWRDRDRHRTLLVIAGAATLLMLIVAALAQTGFTGSLRYVTLPAALLCVLAGAGLPPLAERIEAHGRWRAAVVVTAISVVVALGVVVWGVVRLALDEQRYGRDLPALIDRLGGPRAIRACGPVSSSPFERQAVAWRLHLRQRDVSTHRHPAGGTVLALADSAIARGAPLPVRVRDGAWLVRSLCAPG